MSRLKLAKSDWLDDWYTIDRAEHENRQEFVPDGPNSASLFCSSRISDADVEGDAEEMRGIAQAIVVKSSFRAKRCAVRYLPESESFEFWSPRNSQRPGTVDAESAQELAAQITRELGAPEAAQ